MYLWMCSRPYLRICLHPYSCLYLCLHSRLTITFFLFTYYSLGKHSNQWPLQLNKLLLNIKVQVNTRSIVNMWKGTLNWLEIKNLLAIHGQTRIYPWVLLQHYGWQSQKAAFCIMNLVLAAITVMFRGIMAQLSLTRQPRTSHCTPDEVKIICAKIFLPLMNGIWPDWLCYLEPVCCKKQQKKVPGQLKFIYSEKDTKF